MFNAKILADSVNTAGDRLVTLECTYPQFIHSELLTHRMFSRNSASSRAIPVEKMIANVLKNPVIPIHWGANQKGMQADQELSRRPRASCKKEWSPFEHPAQATPGTQEGNFRGFTQYNRKTFQEEFVKDAA